jgi:hypothetical protein
MVSISIINPIDLIDDHSVTISWGKGAWACVRHHLNWRIPMSIRTTLLVAATVALATLGIAHADGLRPIEAKSIDLGGVSGVAYYTIERGGFRVVATLAQGETGTPVRLVAVLAPGQSVVLSTPYPEHTVEISRQADKVFVR